MMLLRAETNFIYSKFDYILSINSKPRLRIKMKELTINSQMFSKEHLDEVIDECFTLWVSALYGWGSWFEDVVSREISYEEEAEIFLALFKRMVDEELILVCALQGEPEKEIEGIGFTTLLLAL